MLQPGSLCQSCLPAIPKFITAVICETKGVSICIQPFAFASDMIGSLKLLFARPWTDYSLNIPNIYKHKELPNTMSN
jgi:hypothetical protein